MVALCAGHYHSRLLQSNLHARRPRPLVHPALFRVGMQTAPSTMEAFLISRVAVGLPDALLSGLAYDAA